MSGAIVHLYASNGTGDLPYNESVTITSSGTTATVTHSSHGLQTNDWVRITGANEANYNGTFQITVTGTNTYTYTLQASESSPATGTIVCTGAVINATTTGTGVVSDTRTWSNNQPITGYVRKGTSAPYYVESPISGTINSSSGFSVEIKMVRDE